MIKGLQFLSARRAHNINNTYSRTRCCLPHLPTLSTSIPALLPFHRRRSQGSSQSSLSPPSRNSFHRGACVAMSRPSAPPLTASAPIAVPINSSSTWDRITSWAADNKATVYTIAGATLVASSAGIMYYLNSNSASAAGAQRPSKKERRQRKEAERHADVEKGNAQNKSGSGEGTGSASRTTSSLSSSEEAKGEIPEITGELVATLSEQQRTDYAQRLKAIGNQAYGKKDYSKAIEYYSQAILCRPDPIFYSNRAACFNALSSWERVIEDTTAAINLEPMYVKALNRRANAYEHQDQFSEALLDYTASCIIDEFKNDASSTSVERLLKKVAEQKAEAILKSKNPNKLPSPTYVANYIQSFRTKERPAGLGDDETIDTESGKGYLQAGLRAMERRTYDGYEEASTAFEKAIEVDGLGGFEALAYNLRGTFRSLRGQQEEALTDMDTSINLDPTMTQSYVKRASMYLERGLRDRAATDLSSALEKDDTDPDIFYHRAQLHFIHGEYQDAAKDYQKSIDLDGAFIFSHIQLGVTQYKMGSIASSMATFRRCMKNFENTPDVYNYYGELLLDQGKYDEAIQKFETAMEMEKRTKPTSMNVLPLINKALALYQQKSEFAEAEKLCEKALIIDPECDIAVATMAQLLLQQGKVTEALKYFERAADLARTQGEIVNALSYAEASRTQLQVQEKYPQLAAKLQGMGGSAFPGGR